MNMNKLLKIIQISIILHGMCIDVSAEINQFGISNIMIPENSSINEENKMIRHRIAEELGENYTIQDILNFLPKIQAYYDHILNTQNLNEENLLLAKLALIDVKKAKMSPTIKSNTVTPDDEHTLRVELGKLQRQISPNN